MLKLDRVFPASRLKRNTLWNLIGTGAPVLLGAIAVPYLIRRAGLEVVGILTLVWALIGYFSLFDFGLGRALTQQVAARRAEAEPGPLRRLVKTGLLVTLATGAVGGVMLAAAANQLGSHWLKVSDSLREATSHSLWIAALGIPLTTLTSGLKGILEAFEDFRTVNLLRIVLGMANFGFPVLCAIVFGPRLDLMVASLMAARFVIFLAHWLCVNRRLPAFWRAKLYGRKEMMRLLAFGGWMTVSNVISPLLTVSDRFVISYALGAGMVAYYTVPFEVLFRVLAIPMSLTAALFPRLTSLLTTDLAAARKLFGKSMRTVAAVMLPLCVCLAAGSFWGLEIWLGREFALKAWPIAAILSAGVFFNSMAQIPLAALHALGNARITAWIHIGELVFYVPLLFVFLKGFGVLGAAIIWSIRVGCDWLVLLYFAKRGVVA